MSDRGVVTALQYDHLQYGLPGLLHDPIMSIGLAKEPIVNQCLEGDNETLGESPSEPPKKNKPPGHFALCKVSAIGRFDERQRKMPASCDCL